MKKDHIDIKGFLIILSITLLWGLNYSAIKISNTGLSPVFTSFLRSGIAALLGIIYCLIIKEKIFHKGILLFHGMIIGILFGLEFACYYMGLLYTDAARSAIFMYLSPFVVAIGAHIFLKEKLNVVKTIGLVLAFAGIYFVFRGKPSTYNKMMLVGDLLAIIAALFWGATTVYIKKYLADKIHPINTFLYQFIFSVPVLLISAFVLEDKWVTNFNGYIAASIVYQSVIVASVSYFIWFRLIHTYPVAKLSTFTFLTPVFGVLFGNLLFSEELTIGLISGLVLVCAGIYCSNYNKNTEIIPKP
ncbi:MAG: DMT family transporter [Spirochaetota bacterium]